MTVSRYIDRYLIQQELGRGGMAVVYLAHDPRIERDVALKVLPPRHLLDTGLRERFEREAKAIASLEHPAIVPIYDYGEHEGQPYLVMRYMSGGGLDQLIARRPRLAMSYIRHILDRIASALDVAHQRGIIHRDLKPSNILLDAYEDPFLCDFGIVKLVRRRDAQSASSTIVGTPAYMSPEQVRGGKVDGRSDIYGLGAILFELLTRQQPFAGESTTSVLQRQLYSPIPRLNSFGQPFPQACQDVVDRAMAKDPDERFGSATELAADFAQASAGFDPSTETIRLTSPDMTPPPVAPEPPPDAPPEDPFEPYVPESWREAGGSDRHVESVTPIVRWRSLGIELPDEDEGEDRDKRAGGTDPPIWRRLDEDG